MYNRGVESRWVRKVEAFSTLESLLNKSNYNDRRTVFNEMFVLVFAQSSHIITSLTDSTVLRKSRMSETRAAAQCILHSGIGRNAVNCITAQHAFISVAKGLTWRSHCHGPFINAAQRCTSKRDHSFAERQVRPIELSGLPADPLFLLHLLGNAPNQHHLRDFSTRDNLHNHVDPSNVVRLSEKQISHFSAKVKQVSHFLHFTRSLSNMPDHSFLR